MKKILLLLMGLCFCWNMKSQITTYVEVKERPRYNIDVLLESKSVGKEND